MTCWFPALHHPGKFRCVCRRGWRTGFGLRSFVQLQKVSLLSHLWMFACINHVAYLGKASSGKECRMPTFGEVWCYYCTSPATHSAHSAGGWWWRKCMQGTTALINTWPTGRLKEVMSSRAWDIKIARLKDKMAVIGYVVQRVENYFFKIK